MQIFVVNLERRNDRRAAMELQAARLGLSFTFVPAFDAHAVLEPKLRRMVQSGPIGELGIGDIGCFFSHRDVWRHVLASGDDYAVVLEDDARLADDAAALLTDDAWVPEGEHLIKLERRGGSRILTSRAVTDLKGREGRRMFSKSAGSAAYLISAQGAALALEHSEPIDQPVDHFLFNPSTSPVFDRLRPLHVMPTLIEQNLALVTDIPRKETTAERLRADPGRELVRAWHEVRLLPRYLWLSATRQAELVRPTFGTAAGR